jgi:hypothetical protein
MMTFVNVTIGPWVYQVTDSARSAQRVPAPGEAVDVFAEVERELEVRR